MIKQSNISTFACEFAKKHLKALITVSPKCMCALSSCHLPMFSFIIIPVGVPVSLASGIPFYLAQFYASRTKQNI